MNTKSLKGSSPNGKKVIGGLLPGYIRHGTSRGTFKYVYINDIRTLQLSSNLVATLLQCSLAHIPTRSLVLNSPLPILLISEPEAKQFLSSVDSEVKASVHAVNPHESWPDWRLFSKTVVTPYAQC